MSNLTENTGQDPSGKVVALPIAGPTVITTKPLGPGEAFDSGIMMYNGNTTIDMQITADVPGVYQLKYYNKDGTELIFLPAAVIYDPASASPFPFFFQTTLNFKGYGIRVIYTNGSVAQTKFTLAINFGPSSQETQQSSATAITDTNKASVSKTTVQGKQDAIGIRKEVTVTASGNKTAIDVNLVNPAAATDVSTLATSANQTNGKQTVQIVDGNNQNFGTVARPLNVTVSNPQTSVSVSNFPATQPVSGTVNIGNLPTTQPISGSVSVSNLPATQQISGTVQVGNFPTSTEISNDVGNPIPVTGTVAISNPVSSVAVNNFPASQAVTGNFYPPTQPVSGTVAISNPVNSVAVNNFPASTEISNDVGNPIPVSGSVAVSNPVTSLAVNNFPATQAVSGTIGVNNFPATQTVAGSVSVSNFPATQPISAAALPLPTGASTSANQSTANISLNNIDLDLGAPTDPAVTNVANAASVIAALKGIISQLQAGITTTSTSAGGTPQSFFYGGNGTTTGVQTLKTSAGRVTDIVAINTTSNDVFIQFFNTTGAVTLGTTVPTFWYPIDANVPLSRSLSAVFNTGLKFAITTTPTGAQVVSLAYMTIITV